MKFSSTSAIGKYVVIEINHTELKFNSSIKSLLHLLWPVLMKLLWFLLGSDKCKGFSDAKTFSEKFYDSFQSKQYVAAIFGV